MFEVLIILALIEFFEYNQQKRRESILIRNQGFRMIPSHHLVCLLSFWINFDTDFVRLLRNFVQVNLYD